jgi:hypothetical protein
MVSITNSKIFILFIFISLLGHAQVLNVDRENGQDSTMKKFLASFTGSFSSDKQKNKFVEFSNSTELDYILKNHYFFVLLNQTDIAYNGKNSIEDNGFVQLRFRDNDTRTIAPDFYTQFQWNGIWGLESRSLAGLNARINCLEKKKSDLYFSIGAFYEMERWNTKLSSYAYKTGTDTYLYREMLRLNMVTKFAFKIGEKIDFAGISYLQFPINKNFLSPRWVFDSNLYFEFSKHLNFLLRYDFNYDEFRTLPIDDFYYSLNFGVQVKI